MKKRPVENSQDPLQALEALARETYSGGDPSHDFLHVRRVVNHCLRLGKELGADLDVLLPAAWLHDFVQVPKSHPDRAQASRLAAVEAEKILGRLGFTASRIRAIATAILEHGYSAGLSPTSLESAILQDADRLDAIGAIGVARAFSCGTRMGSVFYDLGEPLAKVRPLDDHKFILDHFDVKLFKLAEKFNTEPGKREARRRLEFMRSFVKEFESEL